MADFEFIQEIEIPLYPMKIVLSEERAARYYTKKHKDLLPKYMKEGLAKEKFYWKSNYLFETATNERVVKNKRVVGKPKYFPLSGNAFASGLPFQLRSKIVHELHTFYFPFVQKMKKFTSFPIAVEWQFHSVMSDPLYDLSNMWFYYKYFEDVLHMTEIVISGKRLELEPLIPDDNYLYVTKPGAPIFYPVKTLEQRKFVFRFYKDNRKIIQEAYGNIDRK